MFPRRACFTGLVSLWLVLCCSACGSAGKKPMYPVTGSVFVKKKPAADALVIFTPLTDADPENWPVGYPRGKVAEDGQFRLTTYKDGDGAPAGEYAVTVVWMVGVPGDEEREVDKLKGKYANPKKSKVRVVVQEMPQGNDVPAIQLD